MAALRAYSPLLESQILDLPKTNPENGERMFSALDRETRGLHV